MAVLCVQVADITRLSVDAIVNAANEVMLGGGGVDGAIHAAAGPGLLAACRQVPELKKGVRCPTGEARITPGFLLPARFIIHTVGPIWYGGERGESELLASCYRNVLALCPLHGIRTLAIPAISCGAFRFPVADAARIAVEQIRRALRRGLPIDGITLVAFEPGMASVLEAAVAAPPSQH